jgi:hypothetical protein
MHGIEIEKNTKIHGAQTQSLSGLRQASRVYEKVRDMQDMF